MSEPVTRRALLFGAAGGVTAAAVGSPATAGSGAGVPRLVRELEEKIRAGMAAYGIPGVSYGLHHRGLEYVGGFGVTDVSAPQPVDGDTLFRIASTTKTFTGTAIMRLVERGRLDLDRTVRGYLPGFRTADAAASRRVTLRQTLNHSPGWLGDSFVDTGSGDDALERYVAAMATLPQLTEPGRVFAYNNAAIGVAGRILEVATGQVYEDALRSLVLEPLSLRQSAFAPQDVPGARVAVPHGFDQEGNVVAVPEALAIPRSLHSFGGLFSSARDQLRWARFHLGDGSPLLQRRSLRAMRWRPGPAGVLFVEIDGAGVTWMLRPTAEGPRVVQHGGDLGGQHSGFLFVPERDFALTVLTNSEGGPQLLAELFADDWALSRFAGLHNLPARPRALTPAELAPYEGRYVAQQIGTDGSPASLELELVGAGGRLSARAGGQEALVLPFYRRDRVLAWAPDGADTYTRGDFVRDADGSVGWFRFSGRLFRRHPLGTASPRAAAPATLVPGTLPHPPLR
ncbi:penicillin-binding protein [Actinoplanes philippinensis]|uniref:CubicO group peptidase, beta-lactamase class C family n=1 Tax=Actinoplanes philippinensis TaxID=35752 RepID=A0A1I2A6P1_9ACTN|nr:serine hydrolase domain-containing protein [Actinoplanes philippinensis]GIE75112.1 penicillin-binding protein [Actinoplanes philippinensis]SFE38450.1 CubicO group peptidase, beta-lactamase class C family [Actinoplanes philippinensis]